MSDSKPARPPQVSLAGWLVVGGSVLVVLTAFGQVADVRSLETREAIENSPYGDALGISVTTAQTLMRIALMVAAATAAATAILGWQALQRSKTARVALSVLAVPLFVSGLAGGGFASAVVTAAIVMLWFQPARDWFDGRSRPTVERREPERPVAGRDPLLDLPPPSGPPLHPAPYAAAPAPTASLPARPAAVTRACVITWVGTLAVLAVFAVALLQLLATPEVYVDELRRQNPELTMSDADLRLLLGVVFAVFVAWSAIAAGLALLVWRRVGWASVALLASAALACLTVFAVPLCVVTGILLLRPESRAWLRA